MESDTEFSTSNLHTIQTNVMRMWNMFEKAKKEERDTIDDLIQNNPEFHPELGEKKLEIFDAIQDACKAIIQFNENEYISAIEKMRSDLKEFLEIYSVRDDHSLSYKDDNDKTVHLKDEEAYLIVCNELKVVYDTFSDNNLILIRSPEWRAFRSTITHENSSEI